MPEYENEHPRNPPRQRRPRRRIPRRAAPAPPEKRDAGWLYDRLVILFIALVVIPVLTIIALFAIASWKPGG